MNHLGCWMSHSSILFKSLTWATLVVGIITIFTILLIVPLPKFIRKTYHFYILGESSQKINADLIRQLPSLLKGFAPNCILARNNYVQGMLVLFQRPRQNMEYDLHEYPTPDGGKLYIWVRHPPKGVNTIGTVLILPGVTGHHQEPYLRAAMVHLQSAGWRCVVSCSRAMDEMPLHSPLHKDMSSTNDIRTMLCFIRDEYKSNSPNPIIAVGYSLGACSLIKYLGEQDDSALQEKMNSSLEVEKRFKNPPIIRGAICFSNAIDVAAVVDHLDFSPNVFTRVIRNLLRNKLKRIYFEKNRDIFVKEGQVEPALMDIAMKAGSLHECDSLFTIPLLGFPSVQAYHDAASCKDSFEKIKTPVLSVYSLDDPIVPRSLILEIAPKVCKLNGNIIFALNHVGSHCLYSECLHFDHNQSFQGRLVKEWVEAIYRTVILNSKS
eukprot:GHVL01014704.1.p1 GENE.GHVL01014704.1~~GHVL01014704.1.p1  ORF type:complete len:436 (+),score=33.96 GHVL01014704.1:25-1332(+)